MDSTATGSTPGPRAPAGSRETRERLRDRELAVIERAPHARAGEPGGASRPQIVERSHAARHDDIQAPPAPRRPERRQLPGAVDVGSRELAVARDFVVDDRANPHA